MDSSEPYGIVYLTKDEIMGIHEDIIESDDDAEPGCINDGQIDFAINYISHGHFGKVPESIHEKALSLLRLLSANHSFVDGNKRTALNSTWTFYLLNGYYFDYGEEIKAILKLFAVMENMVDQKEAVAYFESITDPIQEVEMEDPFTESTILIQRIEHLLQEYRDVFDGEEQDIRKTLGTLKVSNDLVVDVESFIEKYDNDEELESGFKEVVEQLGSLEEDIGGALSPVFNAMKDDLSPEELDEFLTDVEADMGEEFRRYIERRYME